MLDITPVKNSMFRKGNKVPMCPNKNQNKLRFSEQPTKKCVRELNLPHKSSKLKNIYLTQQTLERFSVHSEIFVTLERYFI